MAARWINQAKWWTLGLDYVIYKPRLHSWTLWYQSVENVPKTSDKKKNSRQLHMSAVDRVGDEQLSIG